MALRLVLAGSHTKDLQKAETFLRAKGATDVHVVSSQAEVLRLLQSQTDVRRMVVVAEVKTTGGADDVDALSLLQTIPASRRPPIAVMMSNQDDAVFTACVELGALEILQAPISEQADRLHFHTAKWQHTLQKQQQQQQQQQLGADFGADFSIGLGDSAPDGFSLDIPHLGTPLTDESLDELLGPGSAASCGTLCVSEWDQSEQLAQSILPGVFGDDDGASGASPFFDMRFDALASCEAALLLDQPAEGEVSQAQPSGSSDSSVSHLPSISRQASFTTCSLSGKRKSEDFSEQSRGGSTDTSRQSDLMDDARCKKHKVEWTAELHSIFAAAVEKVGVDRAVPSQILADMGAAGRGLTRQNIASHLQKYRARSRAGLGSATAFVGRAASAPASFGLAEPAAGVPLLPLSSCQLPALLPGVPCWAAGGLAAPAAFPVHAGWAAWPAVPPPPATLPASAQPSQQLLASLQEAMREPQGKLPIGLQLDASAVLSTWSSKAHG